MNSTNSPAYYQPGQQTQPPTQMHAQAHPQGPPTTVVGPGLAGVGTLPPNPNQMLSQFGSDNDNLSDPIIKTKELFSQLKVSLSLLLVQLSTVLNPQNDNRNQNENQFQILGKYVENFNRVCDLLIVNLRTVCESQLISNDLKIAFRYYASMIPESNKQNDTQSVSLQLQRIAEFKKLLQEFVSGAGGSVASNSSDVKMTN